MLSRHPRLILLLFGILVVSAGGILVASASQTTLITAERTLGDYWRTSYDILVRPAGTRSPIEEKYGLVEANHLSGVWGGITFEQYEAIRSIPGVEVAAPIAMIGYIHHSASGDSMTLPPGNGIYILEETVTVNDGAQEYMVPPARSYYYSDPDQEFTPLTYNEILAKTGLVLVDRPAISGFVDFPFLIAGIDQTIVSGRYLREDESLSPKVTFVLNEPEALENLPPEMQAMAKKPPINLPILINHTNYVDLIHESELKQAALPSQINDWRDVQDRGGITYLAELPAQSLAATQTDASTIYHRIFEELAPELVGKYEPMGAPMMVGFSGMQDTPAPIAYKEAQTRFDERIALEIVPPENPIKSDWPQYRASLGFVEFQAIFMWDPIGIFDIERLPKSADVNRVPLETYFPPIAILRYDQQGNPVDPPRELRPTLNPNGYIQSPPLILTTLEAARAMRGETAISAIRVRVALDECPPDQPESCTLTDADQRKIEAIAIEIQRQIGLDVDIMVGSSPTRVLVHVPGIGYVEEQWIQKGVNLVYKRGIQTGNWLLLGTLLLAGSLFTLDMAWAEVLSRRRVIALQKALGWRSRTVFTQIVRQVVIIGGIATLTGTLIAWVLIRLLEWEAIPLNLLIALPLIVIVLCIVGSLLPAWSASRLPPILELQRGGVQYQSHKHTSIVSALWSYAWSEIQRRRVRSVLTGMGSTLSAALLTLLLGVTLQQRGMLGGTLLGEFILVNVQGYHYAIVGIGLGLAFLSTFNGLLGSILERRREIGVLKAIGWRTVSVARVFILQGILLGVIGGSLGALIGALAFLYFYQSVSTSLALAFALGIGAPGLVGALAALYPARLAANVPPAEAVRYE
jgi:hypothetical protein